MMEYDEETNAALKAIEIVGEDGSRGFNAREWNAIVRDSIVRHPYE